MKAQGGESILEPSFRDPAPQTPRDAYEGVSRLDQYATGVQVPPKSESGPTLSGDGTVL